MFEGWRLWIQAFFFSCVGWGAIESRAKGFALFAGCLVICAGCVACNSCVAVIRTREVWERIPRPSVWTETC